MRPSTQEAQAHRAQEAARSAPSRDERSPARQKQHGAWLRGLLVSLISAISLLSFACAEVELEVPFEGSLKAPHTEARGAQRELTLARGALKARSQRVEPSSQAQRAQAQGTRAHEGLSEPHVGSSPPSKAGAETPSSSQALTRALKVSLVRGRGVSERQLERLAGALPKAVERVEGRLGLTLPAQLTLHLSRGASEMKQEAHSKHGWAPPEWANGLAYPREGVIYLHLDAPSELERTLTHELAHLALSAEGAPPLPLWLNEGLAVWVSERVSLERMKTLTEARLAGQLLPFERLERSFPSSSTRAQLAYAQSAHFVTYLADERGELKLQRLLRALLSPLNPLIDAQRAPQRLQTLSEEALGEPLQAIERQWSASLAHSAPAALTLLAQEGAALSLALMLAVLMGLWRWLTSRASPEPSTSPQRERSRRALPGVRVPASARVDDAPLPPRQEGSRGA